MATPTPGVAFVDRCSPPEVVHLAEAARPGQARAKCSCAISRQSASESHTPSASPPLIRVAQLPAWVSGSDTAGVLVGGTAAQNFLRDRASGQQTGSALVNGASRAVGTHSVQLAKHDGSKVTVVTSAAIKCDVTDLGADNVIVLHQRRISGTHVGASASTWSWTASATLTIESGRRSLHPRRRDTGACSSEPVGSEVRRRGTWSLGSAPEQVEENFEFLLQSLCQRQAAHSCTTAPTEA